MTPPWEAELAGSMAGSKEEGTASHLYFLHAAAPSPSYLWLGFLCAQGENCCPGAFSTFHPAPRPCAPVPPCPDDRNLCNPGQAPGMEFVCPAWVCASETGLPGPSGRPTPQQGCEGRPPILRGSGGSIFSFLNESRHITSTFHVPQTPSTAFTSLIPFNPFSTLYESKC